MLGVSGTIEKDAHVGGVNEARYVMAASFRRLAFLWYRACVFVRVFVCACVCTSFFVVVRVFFQMYGGSFVCTTVVFSHEREPFVAVLDLALICFRLYKKERKREKVQTPTPRLENQ